MAVPQWLAEYAREHGRWLYHHTPTRAVRERILADGLVPAALHGGARFTGGPAAARRECVYLGDEDVLRSHYGFQDGHVVAVDVLALDPQRLWPDERVFFWCDYHDTPDGLVHDWSAAGLTDPGTCVGAGRRYRTAGDWAREQLRGQQQRWAALSLGVEGVLAHEGVIPVSALRPAEAVQPVR